MKGKKLLWGFLLIAVIAGIFLLFRAGVFSRKDPIYIAVTVPGEDVSLAGTERSINAIQMYLDQANAEGGVNGHPLKMLVKVDGGDPAQAEGVAEEIIQENKAMIVLGNGYSDAATAIGKVFAANEIPAMTAGATAPSVTEGNEWFFRVINDNISQGKYMADYAHVLFGYETAAIIYEDNAYGDSLGQTIEKSFRDNGGEVIDRSAVTYKSESLEEDISRIVDSYEETPDIVFLATYKTSGAFAVMYLREHHPDLPIMGGDDLGDAAFAERVAKFAGASKAATLTDGIYAASPLIFDVASDQAQFFRDEYSNKFGEVPTWFTATSYESALVAVEAMRAAGISGHKNALAEDRRKLRDYLASVDRVEDGYSEPQCQDHKLTKLRWKNRSSD